jgi:DnaJ-class molecular chaperone
MNNMNNEKKEKYEHINKILEVTLEQIYNEENINFTYQQNVYCNECNGNGTNNGMPNICNSCNGKGVNIQIVKMGPMIQQSVGNCQKCNGTGKIKDNNNICNICSGECFIKKTKTIQIPLKAGLTHNNKINLSGKGNHYKNCKTDLILTINELNHPCFKRYENDLYIEITLKLYQALFGFTKEIIHLDNRKLYITTNDKTDFNSIRKINNEGMQYLQSKMKGNLYIKFNIDMPCISSLDINSKNQLKQLLQNINLDEFNSEKNINNNKNKLILNNCSIDESNKINNNFNNIKENINDDINDDNNDNNNYSNSNECRQS